MWKRLALSLLCLGLSSASAKWDGFRVCTSASISGHSTSTKDFQTQIPLSISGGYGLILPGYFSHGMYVGADLEPLNFTFHAGNGSGSNEYAPKLVLRFGLPYPQALPYAGLSLGYYSGDDSALTWGIRAGVDIDFIHPGFFWGVHLDWYRTFNAKGDNFSILAPGFNFGYRF